LAVRLPMCVSLVSNSLEGPSIPVNLMEVGCQKIYPLVFVSDLKYSKTVFAFSLGLIFIYLVLLALLQAMPSLIKYWALTFLLG
jgi:hypothetical protein